MLSPPTIFGPLALISDRVGSHQDKYFLHVIDLSKVLLEAFEVFQDRNRNKDFNYLQDGAFQPYYPSNDLQQVFEKNYQKTGLNPWGEAQGTIDTMYDKFFDLRFEDEWNFKLEDFLPKGPQRETKAEIKALTPPLAEQPPVDAKIIDPQQGLNTMQTGLTHVEQGLLSDEEKMMKLRQRGMV